MKNLLRAKLLGHPKDQHTFVVAQINIKPNSEVHVDFKYGNILPFDYIANALVVLVLYQAVNIRLNLSNEVLLVQDAYREMMSDIITNWPVHQTAEAGDFSASLPFFNNIFDKNDWADVIWAANGGEKIELKLAKTPSNPLFLYDFYPGMPGYGPAGMAINLVAHYIFLVDMVLTMLDDITVQHLGQVLSELWLNHLAISFDTSCKLNRLALYDVAQNILEPVLRNGSEQ